MTSKSPVVYQNEIVSSAPSIRRYYVLALLTLVYSVNFLDRTVFNVLIDPIKKELGLSDTVMGLIAGPGFIFFYAVTGIPFARLADRFSRRNLVAAATVLWSVMTALCGTAQSAVSLAIARVGVGIGEAGSGPASHSMISDLFSKIERVRALGVYALGVSLGSAVGYASGGWLNQHYGWRMAFFFAGLPGLIAALLLLLTSNEPQRGAQESDLVSLATQSFKQTLAFLWRQKTFVLVACGFCFTAFGNYTIAVWIPSFLVRVHHLTSAQMVAMPGLRPFLE